MIKDITPVSDIDWDSPGARLYHVPFTYDATWGRMRLPLYVACGPKSGKTVVAIGGTHGNEFEGPVGLKNLVNEFDADRLQAGRLIVIPTLNVPAFYADRRDSPMDGKNLNRVFPGDANGSITERIASFVTHDVLSRSDVVIDIHAAGHGGRFAPCTSFHAVEDPALYQQYVETAKLFGMPFIFIYSSGMGTGLLTEEAEAMGKITIGGEFGYAQSADRIGVRNAHHGVINVMRHFGLIDEPIESLVDPDNPEQVVVAATDIDRYITAPFTGIAEPLVDQGDFVEHGTPVIRMHDFERIDEPGVDIRADADGYVLSRRFRAWTTQGDVIMVIAQAVND
jgi:predicted deacylase